MTTAEAAVYLRKRTDRFLTSYQTQVTRWTANDITAVRLLLGSVAAPPPTLEQIIDASETMAEQEQPDTRA